jgi:hypothetical protein
MKKLFILSIILGGGLTGFAQQNFATNISTAKTSYTSGKLEDAHFALQQALQEIDITIGKEVLKLFPAKMDSLNANMKDDNVSGNSGYIGATIHRSYGVNEKRAELEVISNSPLIGSLNMFLNSSLGGFMNDGKTKSVKVQGYKGRLTQQEGNGENAKPTYRLEIPFNNALLSVNITNSSDTEVLKFANSLPLADIAKLIQ